MAEKNVQQRITGGVVAAGEPTGGFFTIHRRGQGKWTRLGTAVTSAVVIFGTALFLHRDVAETLRWSERTALIVAGATALVLSVFAYWVQNRPGNVAFLIDTDSEMKKVNWTSRQELIGSTRVVIVFMLLLAGMLFVVDIIFGYFFQWIGVLKFGPFGS